MPDNIGKNSECSLSYKNNWLNRNPPSLSLNDPKLLQMHYYLVMLPSGFVVMQWLLKQCLNLDLMLALPTCALLVAKQSLNSPPSSIALLRENLPCSKLLQKAYQCQLTNDFISLSLIKQMIVQSLNGILSKNFTGFVNKASTDHARVYCLKFHMFIWQRKLLYNDRD